MASALSMSHSLEAGGKAIPKLLEKSRVSIVRGSAGQSESAAANHGQRFSHVDFPVLTRSTYCGAESDEVPSRPALIKAITALAYRWDLFSFAIYQRPTASSPKSVIVPSIGSALKSASCAWSHVSGRGDLPRTLSQKSVCGVKYSLSTSVRFGFPQSIAYPFIVSSPIDLTAHTSAGRVNPNDLT